MPKVRKQKKDHICCQDKDNNNKDNECCHEKSEGSEDHTQLYQDDDGNEENLRLTVGNDFNSEIKEAKSIYAEDMVKKLQKPTPWMIVSIFLLITLLLNQLYIIQVAMIPKHSWMPGYTGQAQAAEQFNSQGKTDAEIDSANIIASVVTQDGIELPIKWDDLGKKMVEAGVIDETKFKNVFNNQLTTDQEAQLTGNWDKPIILTQENSRFVLDLLWALGLANKNDILDTGEMQTATDGKPGGMASTGGWRLSRDDSMNHYSKYEWVSLTDSQQQMVADMAKGIFRPCCGNSVHFPDCNHGMAMLGLLELMAANGASEQEMWDVALEVNSLWFPDTYIQLATYFKEQGKNWDEVDPKVVLSSNYSSSRGFANIRSQIKSIPQPQQGGGGCGA